MRLLLDTHVLLWRMGGVPRLGPEAADAVREAQELLVSTVSFAEIGIKISVGKLEAPDDLRARVEESGARILGLAPDHGLGVSELPLHHRDPFDRLLISQARSEGLTVITADRRFAHYDVPLVSALA
jgi:PIN domain nuclease of toxin-antitoxin system